ncbi:MAG TPA: isochorismatase family protein [Stellaceae bacterium]|nr:isochorismatase family protein [Stellaceae bacterium]
MDGETDVFRRQGFGAPLGIVGGISLLIVDFVTGFADPAHFGGGNIPAAIAATVPVLAHARSSFWPIAFTRIVFADDGSDRNIFCLKVPPLGGLTEADPLSAIVPQLAPRPGELVVRKTVPSGFLGTGLAPWLAQHGVQTVIVAGCTTSGCVRASVVDAMSFGYRPIVLRDCVGDRALAPHEASLFDMGQKYADILTADTVLARAAA